MTIARAQAVRSSNPGIVPPWLQGPTRPAQAPALTAPASTTHAAAGEASRNVFVPIGRTSDGAIIVMDVPDGMFPRLPGGASNRPSSPQQPNVDSRWVAREQARTEETVNEVRAFYKRIGVTDAEGADQAAAVEFLPDFDNAAYLPKDAEGAPVDHVHIGMDPRSGRSFNDSKEVIAHEWGHRVVDRITHGRLSLSPLSADVAVHESLADTFAAAFDADDWTIGEDMGDPIRVMNHPELLGHPGHVRDLARVMAPDSPFMVEVGEDQRTGQPVMAPDWHVIAAIPNKAASMIGDALGRDTMAKIYLKALRDNVSPGGAIEGLAVATMIASKDLFGTKSPEFQATQDAWDAVGVLDLIKQHAQQGAAQQI